MIELRWLRRTVIVASYADGDNINEYGKTVRVLQYRVLTPYVGLNAKTGWSDWCDVPTETEGG